MLVSETINVFFPISQVTIKKKTFFLSIDYLFSPKWRLVWNGLWFKRSSSKRKRFFGESIISSSDSSLRFFILGTIIAVLVLERRKRNNKIKAYVFDLWMCMDGWLHTVKVESLLCWCTGRASIRFCPQLFSLCSIQWNDYLNSLGEAKSLGLLRLLFP